MNLRGHKLKVPAFLTLPLLTSAGMPNTLLQILDDNLGDFKYGGAGNWTLDLENAWYLQTTSFPRFSSAGGIAFGTFFLTFEGISVAFTGNTPHPDFSQVATVSIDGGTPYNVTYPGQPQLYVQWYQSPTLSEGTHTIVVEHLDGTAVDYALIEVGQNTALSGKTLIIDNDDQGIQYSGQWQRNTDQFIPFNLPNGYPLRNSTHRSSNPGDGFSFEFIGTSVSIYGIINYQDLGTLSATYTLDGITTSQSYPVTLTAPEHMSQDQERSNFLYFSLDDLSAGSHTVVVKITECQNSQYVFDYVTYVSSFATLADMPDSGSSLPSNSSSTRFSSDHTTPTSSNGPLSPSITPAQPTELPNAPVLSNSNSGKSKPHVRDIVGGTVGAATFVIVFAFVSFLIWKRRSRPPSVEDDIFPFRLGVGLYISRPTLAADLKRSKFAPRQSPNNTASSRIPTGVTSRPYVPGDAEPPAYDGRLPRRIF